MDTNAYIQDISQQEEQTVAHFFRHPPAKRVNYDRLNVFSPFGPRWIRTLQSCQSFMLSNCSRREEITPENGDGEKEEHDEERNLNSDINVVSPILSHSSEPTDHSPSQPVEELQPTEVDIDRQNVSSLPLFVVRGKAAEILIRSGHLLNRCEASQQLPFKIRELGIPLEVWNQGLVGVNLLMIRRGTPKVNAMICLPVAADFSKVREFLAKVRHHPEVDQSEEGSNDEEEQKDSETDAVFSLFFPKEPRVSGIKRIITKTKEQRKARGTEVGESSTINQQHSVVYIPDPQLPNVSERLIMGYTTVGFHSQTNSRGKASGFCSLLALQQLFHLNRRMRFGKSQLLVWIRNVDSDQYLPAYAQLFSPYSSFVCLP